jgi:DNA-binding MarR family transcriptional regulator
MALLIRIVLDRQAGSSQQAGQAIGKYIGANIIRTMKQASARIRTPASGVVSPPAGANTSQAPAVQALRQFRQIYAAVRTHFHEVEQLTGTGPAQLRALSILRERPATRVSELAAAMDIHQSTASNLVKALIARKLIRSSRSDADARVLLLRLLPAGERILQRLPGAYVGVLPRALQTLPEAVLRRLNADLDTLLAAMGADDSTAQSPLASL